MNLSVYVGYQVYLGGVDLRRAALENGQELHEAMAAAVEMEVGEHLRGLNSRSPNTGFYAAAARGVETEAARDRALVRIPKLGFALRYYGGRVLPGKGISSHTGKLTTSLALPTDEVPVVGPADGRYRQRPGEAGPLAFIPNRKGGNTVGYLLEGEPKTITRGKNKGKERMVPKAGGKMLYVLTKEVTQNEDPSVLPPKAALQQAAQQAATDYLASFDDEGGGA